MNRNVPTINPKINAPNSSIILLKKTRLSKLMWLRLISVLIGSHCIRYASEWMYWNQCAGFVTSIFSYNSPTCVGLRWVADSLTTKTVSVIGTLSVQCLHMLA